MYLTKSKVAQVLKQNEGFKRETYVNMKNFKCAYLYFVKGGKLFRRESGRTSWSDSRFHQTIECSPEQVRRFIHEWKNCLNLKGIEYICIGDSTWDELGNEWTYTFYMPPTNLTTEVLYKEYQNTLAEQMNP